MISYWSKKMIKLSRPACPDPIGLKSNYKLPINKNALRIANNDKCMYCESKISHIDFAHVEHIKPKSVDKFPELTYEWTNLGYSCPKCNNFKSEKYEDDTPFIDPYSEDPENHLISYGTMIMPKNGCERGEITIREIGINRNELIEKRYEKINEISSAIKACFRTKNESLRNAALEELKMEAEANKEFSFTVRTLLKLHDII